MKTYIFIDTNIWFRFLSQSRPGCEMEHIDALAADISEKNIHLIVPEVVELELEKKTRFLIDDLKENLAKLEKKIKEVTLWNEMDDLTGALADFFENWRGKKVATAESHMIRVRGLMRLPQVIRVPFTAEVDFKARRRLMAGRMPKVEKTSSNDAAIIESLLAVVVADDNSQLYFCSANITDFALQAKDQYVLHPLLKEGFPATRYSTSLQQLVETYRSEQKVVELPKADLQEALEKDTENRRGNLEDVWCRLKGCRKSPWILGPYCQQHLQSYLKTLPDDHRASVTKGLSLVLRVLSYREREIIKLEGGISDGYIYTRQELAHIFRTSVSTIRRIEARAAAKLAAPEQRERIRRLFDSGPVC